MEHGKPIGVTDAALVDFAAVCQKVRGAVEPARAHAVSLHDQKGDVLWLSESSMGPDEHNAVRESVAMLSDIAGPAVVAHDLGDSRSAVLLRAVDARRSIAGIVMVIMDTRVLVRDDKGVVRMMTPRLQRALADFAALRPGPALVPAPVPVPPVALSLAVQPEPGATGKRPAVVSPDIDRLHAALRRSPIALHVQRLVPLSKGSQLKRYEVLLRSKSEAAPDVAPHAMLKAAVDNGLGSMIDRRVVTELIGWLVHHPDVWQKHAVMFSVNLTITALHDEHFIKFVGLCLEKSALPKAMIAFEIDVTAAVKLGDRILEIAAAMHRLGCPMVLDDFGMRTECFDLLRLPAVRYIKLAPAITAKMRSDKVAQASITAVVQMARVLGMHTVAKRAENAAEREWLTALGVDFIQSNAFSPAAPIDSLSKADRPTP